MNRNRCMFLSRELFVKDTHKEKLIDLEVFDNEAVMSYNGCYC